MKSFIKQKGLIILSLLAIQLPLSANEWKIQDTLPESWKNSLKVSGEMRYRFEHRDNLNFNNDVNDEDALHLWRTRLNVEWTPSSILSSFVQLQFADVTDQSGGRNNATADDLDIRQAYIKATPLENQPLALTVGRQELSYGDQRLIGGFNWSNVAQSFDAIKLTYAPEPSNTDIFIARRQIIDRTKLNNWDDNDLLFGLYESYKLEDLTLDGYYFYRDTSRNLTFGNTAATMNESTIGFRINGTKNAPENVDYNLESAYQWGNFGNQEIQAYMFTSNIGYTFDTKISPRLDLEWSHASGDSDLSDNKRTTFDNLFPTNHLYYGYMDRISLQNIDDIKVGLTLKPLDKLKLIAAYHLFYADKSTDHVYNAGRGILRTSAGPSTGEHIGNELDIVAKYKLTNNTQLEFGYSYFWAGEYLEDTGSSDNGNFTYASVSVSF